MNLFILWLLALLFTSSAADPNYVFMDVQYIPFDSETGKATSNRFIGLGASFGGDMPIDPVNGTMVKANPWQACSPLVGNYSGKVVLAERGNCTFVEKALNIQNSGAILVVIKNTENAIESMGGDDAEAAVVLPCFMISSVDGDTLHSSSYQLLVSVYLYKRPNFDMAVVILMLMAVGIVSGAAYWSAEFERKLLRAATSRLPRPNANDEMIPHEYLGVKQAAGFVVIASATLVVLFFFMEYLIYVLIAFFVIGGTEGLLLCSIAVADELLAERFRTQQVKLPWLGDCPLYMCLLFIPSLTLSVVWAIYRNQPWAWVLQNIMAMCLLFLVQKLVRLPDIKVSSILLTCAFLYDIFWVFLSPLIFEKSVMVEVATGGGTGESIPMVMSFPRFNDEMGGASLLGCIYIFHN
jgi:signal peptide peptidase-like protein 2B